MTAEKYLLDNRIEVFGEYGDTSQMEEFAKSMQEYTRIKCQELLLLVAEKASKLPATIFISRGTCNTARLDKDSILNAVDLDSFIV